MVDLVGTCPQDFWDEWIAEGDAAGEPESGDTYAWYTRDGKALTIRPGDRLYIVAHGRLRGYAPVVSLQRFRGGGYAIIRGGGAVACTIDEPVRGFQGLRKRWWPRESERPFPDWRVP
jgi:hypothetical protein